MTSHFAIPDVHGDPAALGDMIQIIPSGSRVVFLGDLVNKGPSWIEALERLHTAALSDCWYLLWGNHDLLFARAVRGSREAQFNLFAQRKACSFFAEIGEAELGVLTDHAFRHSSAAGQVDQALEQHAPLFDDINRAFAAHGRLQELVAWMIERFRLFDVSDRGVLSIHAGIPVTEAGIPVLSIADLVELDRRVSDALRSGRVDDPLFSTLELSEHSPLRLLRWLNYVSDPREFCSLLGVRALVVGHAEVDPESLAGEPFPIIRHDFGASCYLGGLPSVCEVTVDGRVVTHLKRPGGWVLVERGSLTR